MNVRLIAAAKVAAEALAEAECVIENEWGRVLTRKEWEAGYMEVGPSDVLKELRAAIVEAENSGSKRGSA